MKNSILIVGAGFAGATYARLLAEAGYNITLIDQRNHIGGNAFDYVQDNIRIHKYGCHAFHTKNLKVVQFLSQFTEWEPYKHLARAEYKGIHYPIPLTKKTIDLFGIDQCIDIFIKTFTEKFWGLEFDKVDKKLIYDRIPIKTDNDPYYFPNDEFQALPSKGYTNLFNNMLDHDNISIVLNTQFNKSFEKQYNFIFNSMAIDEYYDNRYGELPYRSIKFSHEVHDKTLVLPNGSYGQLLLPENNGPTRFTEWKKLPAHCLKDTNKTIITVETPCDYKDNNNERYYPIIFSESAARDLYKRYKEISNDKVKFIGRCGTYQYLNMDQVINQSMLGVRKFLANVK